MSSKIADFVIVGAGSAGCALASRLSESGKYSVAILEAGSSDRHPWIKMPIGYGKAFYHEGMNWKYTTQAVDGLDGQENYWPRGKVLGGSSSINAMVFIRGQKQDFDIWESHGNPGWGFKDVLPVFKRMENNSAGADEWRGVNGPLSITHMASQAHPLCNTFLEGCRELGLRHNADFNGESQEGVGTHQITTRNGFRCSSADAYLRPAMKRQNFSVETNAHCVRLLFEGRRVTGIVYQHHGASKEIRARREIILSAGAINTPQILQLSGIGDPKLLQDHGIDNVVPNSSVGQNLQDHLAVDYLYESNRPSLNDILRPWSGRITAGLQYLIKRSGPLSLSVNQAGGFVRSDASHGRPNLQLYFSPLSYTKSIKGKRPLLLPDKKSGFSISVSNCHPISRGFIRIGSDDPFAPPEIHPGYYTAEEDIAEMLQGVHIIRGLTNTKAMRHIIEREILPGSTADSDEQIIADIRKRSSTVFHPCGTCVMGPDPRHHVVDPKLKVHGLDGLRIADASIFPTIPSGNINAASIMVGEKAADLLLDDAD